MRSSVVPREVLALAGVAFCVALGFGVVTPAIPLFAKEFGVGATAAGAVVSAFALMRLVFGPFGGRLVDRLGERTALVAGLALVALSSLLAGLSQNYPQLLVLRAVGGIGSAVFTVAATSLVIRVAAARYRGRAMSIYQSGYLLGGIAGPAAGGAVLGFSLRAPFFAYAATLGMACVVALLFLTGLARKPVPPTVPEPAATSPDGAGSVGPRSADAGPAAPGAVDSELAGREPPAAPGTSTAASPEPTMRLRDALRMREYQASLAANLAVGFALFGMRSALVPLLVVDQVHAELEWVAWSFLASSVAQTALMFPAGRLVDAIGRRLPLLGGALLTALGLVMVGFSTSLPMLITAMIVLGVGGAFLGPIPGALLGDVVRGRGGTVVAVSQMTGDVGAVLGPLVAGLLAERLSFAVAFGTGAVIVAGAGLFGLLLPRRPPEADDAGPAGTPGGAATSGGDASRRGSARPAGE